ncbi:MAG TPA: AbrB family transcriptional regulator [Geobacter sp.]|nr:AbrB family transcriptional regulator [Geobacter sp.]
METTTLSSKGQIIIPKILRDTHQWRPGTKFFIEDTETGLVLRPAGGFTVTDLEEGLGCAGYSGAAKSVDEMKEGIDEALKRDWKKVVKP